MDDKVPATTGIRQLQTTQKVVDYFTALLGTVTFGFSDIMGKAVHDLIDRRLGNLRDILIDDLAHGRIPIDKAISDDNQASFVLRIAQAARDGSATKKLQLMARYFYRNPADDLKDDAAFLDAAGTIEALSDDDLRCLAIIKFGLETGTIDPKNVENGIAKGVDLLGLFDDYDVFIHVVQSLVRFGFIRLVSGFGNLIVYVQPRLLVFLRELKVEDFKPD